MNIQQKFRLFEAKEGLVITILGNIYIRSHNFWAGRYHQRQIKLPSQNTAHGNGRSERPQDIPTVLDKKVMSSCCPHQKNSTIDITFVTEAVTCHERNTDPGAARSGLIGPWHLDSVSSAVSQRMGLLVCAKDADCIYFARWVRFRGNACLETGT